MAESLRRRGSLRRRLLLWMSLSAVLSIAAFAATSFLFVNYEEQEELVRPSRSEGPEQIAADTAEELLAAMAVSAPIALVLAIAGAFWVSRRVLKPLYEVVRTADEMTAEELHRRLVLPQGDAELVALVGALNGLFERLESGFGALERYAADASHELRTPLAVIASELEVALRHPRTAEEWQRVAATALDEVRRLTRLVEALLELSRLSSLPPDVELTPFDFGESLAQALGPLSAAAEARGVTLRTHLGGGSPAWIRGNAEALAEAAANLVDNAVRYTPPGGNVEVAVERGPDARVRFVVDDSGPGVAEEERERIFAPFERGTAGRADVKSAQDGRGVGLGLAMARRIADLHDGTLAVERSPLGGARFVLSLPTV